MRVTGVLMTTDDKEEIVRERLLLHHRYMLDLKAYYCRKDTSSPFYFQVDGHGNIDEISQFIVSRIKG